MPGIPRKDHAAELRDQIISAMVELPFIAAVYDRRLLIRLIRLEIVDFPDIRESQETRLHVVEIVLACLRHPGGLRALRNALRTMDPDAASSRRVRHLIESANLLALLPEEAIAEAKGMLAKVAPMETPAWRTTFRTLDRSNRTTKTISRLSLVDAFDILCHRPGDPVPPGLAFIDELSRQVDGVASGELKRWAEIQAKHLGVMDELLGVRPAIPTSGNGQTSDSANGNLPTDNAQNTQSSSDFTTEQTSSSEADEGDDALVGDRMPPVETATPAKEKLPLVWGNVPPRNPNFTGREALLQYLHTKLQMEREAAVLPRALHGMGGVGKSQIAIEYVHRHRSDYDLIWWIPADRKVDILASLADLAFRLKLDMTRQANNAVPVLLDALNTGQIPYENWLLIFDNAEDVAEARAYFPSGGNGTILVTSRNLEWALTAEESIEVDVFTPEESRKFLLNRSPDLSPQDADRLGEELGYLPLAVEQAASWHAVTGMPVTEYLELLQAKRIELLSQTPSAQDQGSVAAAWNVSLDRLEQKNPAALQLLQVCSFFAPSDISRDLFVAAPVRITAELDTLLGDSIQLARAIRDIQSYALARLNHQDSTLQIHRLIQAVLMSRLDDSQRELMRFGAHALLVNADPKHPHLPEQWSRYQMLHKHFEASRVTDSADPLIHGLTMHMVEFLFYWGAHAECRDIATRVHATWTEKLGFEHPQNLKLATWLGYICWVLGDFARARQVNRQAFEAYDRTFGPDDEGTLNASRMVCTDLRAAGRFQEAKERNESIYKRSRTLFGPDDPATLHAAHDLGVSLRLTGEFARAIELDDETARRRTEVLGRNHTETLRTLNGLAVDRREAGHFVEAHRLQEQIYKRHLEIMGADKPMSLHAARNLAVARRKSGDHGGAKELSEVTVEKFRRRYGTDYPETMAAELNYAVDLRQVGQLDDARELGGRLVERYRRALGAQHAHTLSAQTNLAIVYRLQGDPEQAHALNKQVYETLTETLGADHPVTLTCAINLASDLYTLGEAQAAYELDSETLERSQRVLGAEHPSVLACSANLALDLRRLGRTAEAEKIQGNTMALFRKVLGDKHPATLNALQSIRADCDVDPMPL
ncbi:FxSxx-COOH system tetratricopeptide repeat protein [Allorhizocola rhizosphaerae]|uniref:FxSxx-COOH system tetratricopeptide repeat protein n=1 Tax=Allorhizocola rhizosphaerae TaxID=1872709 RepID=UPI0013C2BA97|nr:FxSxx-COOH system tetratricopeptide repeat protein [Allorhizocola rhizosphaerae]